MHTRIRVAPLIFLLVVGLGLAGSACGGGDSQPKPGTPAATGVAPDCSFVPLDLVAKSLELEITGPLAQTRPNGNACIFARPSGGASAIETVLFNGNEDKQTFAIIRDGYKSNNIKVNNIGNWGDEAYAVKIRLFADLNTFSVRKGKVAVTITSVAEFDQLKTLMKAILEKV